MATVLDQVITVQGPLKMEIIHINDVSTADTVTSNIVSPSFGFFVQTSGNSALGTSVGISGRVVTLTNSNFSTDSGVLILFGF